MRFDGFKEKESKEVEEVEDIVKSFISNEMEVEPNTEIERAHQSKKINEDGTKKKVNNHC